MTTKSRWRHEVRRSEIVVVAVPGRRSDRHTDACGQPALERLHPLQTGICLAAADTRVVGQDRPQASACRFVAETPGCHFPGSRTLQSSVFPGIADAPGKYAQRISRPGNRWAGERV